MGTSRQIKNVAKISLSAEALAFSTGVDSAYYTLTLLTEVIYWITDDTKPSVKAFFTIKASLMVLDQENIKRLRNDINILREMMSKTEVKKIERLLTNKKN